MTAFEEAFEALIKNEGRYVNNPADPGGETCYGVTLRVARAYGYQGPMKELPLTLACEIAKKQYWDKVSGDKLPPAVAFQVFDAYYNGGPAAKWLQQAVGVEADGVLGPVTLAAVNAADSNLIIRRFNAYRLKYLCSLSVWPTFGRGWATRIADNLLK